jgi:4-hydroxy-3-methylbut-2-en-1-yl diphosphate reductase
MSNLVTKLNPMKVTIDPDAGFCFGVERAIRIAEEELSDSKLLLSLGDMVHNAAEMGRLRQTGLKVITHDDLESLKGKKVLIRAHGEPPSTFEKAKDSGVELIDATCPIVIKLQEKVRKAFEENQDREVQILVFGKHGHPEVLGLQGQVEGKVQVVNNVDDLESVDFTQPVRLFCQTTMSAESYDAIADVMRRRMQEQGNEDLVVNKSFCRQVSGRTESLRKFAAVNEVIIFASDKKSSNGQYLFGICAEVNARSFFVNGVDDIQAEWFEKVNSVGITGATSTPRWLMEQLAKTIELF